VNQSLEEKYRSSKGMKRNREAVSTN